MVEMLLGDLKQICTSPLGLSAPGFYKFDMVLGAGIIVNYTLRPGLPPPPPFFPSKSVVSEKLMSI